MTRLVARLILAMLTLPVAGTTLVLGVIVTLALTPMNGPPPAGGFTTTWLAVYAVTGVWWILVWREIIRWTASRIALTALAGLGALGGGIALGLFVIFASRGQAPPGIAVAVGGGLPPILWVAATVFIWRETPAERAARLSAMGGTGLCCPLCSYPMASLHTSDCPECGARFTIEQLLIAQRQRDASTLHDVEPTAT